MKVFLDRRDFIFHRPQFFGKVFTSKDFRDFKYYREKGYFESDYYYPVKLNPIKKLIGKFYDFVYNRIYARP